MKAEEFKVETAIGVTLSEKQRKEIRSISAEFHRKNGTITSQSAREISGEHGTYIAESQTQPASVFVVNVSSPKSKPKPKAKTTKYSSFEQEKSLVKQGIDLGIVKQNRAILSYQDETSNGYANFISETKENGNWEKLINEVHAKKG